MLHRMANSAIQRKICSIIYCISNVMTYDAFVIFFKEVRGQSEVQPAISTAFQIKICSIEFDLISNFMTYDAFVIVSERFADNVRCHPKYLSGEWDENEILRSFLDTFDDQNDPDGVVTREEFLDYYAGVSATVEEDAYFDLMMRSSYGLPKKGSNNRKK